MNQQDNNQNNTIMRKILLAMMLAVIAVGANAQGTGNPLDESGRIVQCNLSKDKLWSNLKKWVAKEFVSYKYTVDMEDKDAGTLILKFNNFDERGGGAFLSLTINATLQIDVKENKYRYSISNASFKLTPNSMCDNLTYASTPFLKRAKLEMVCAENIIRAGTEIPSMIDFVESYYGEKLKKTPKYKKPRDENKGKINPEYEEIEKTISMAGSIDTKLSLTAYDIRESLEKGMCLSSDNW